MSTTFPTELEPTKAEPLPDRYEIIHGQVVECPPMSFYSEEVGYRLDKMLSHYLFTNDIGRSRVEALFVIPQPEDRARRRRPDVAFITYDRWPKDRPISLTGNGLDVVPNLVVEVISPTDYAEDLQGKVQEYLSAGVQLVWLIYPRLAQVHTMDNRRTVQIFQKHEPIQAAELLPGFAFQLADLLPPVLEEEDRPSADENNK